MFRRLYIKYKIWRLQSQVNYILSETKYYWVSLMSMSIRHYDNKMDVEKIFNDFVKQQIIKKKSLLQEIEKLKKSL